MVSIGDGVHWGWCPIGDGVPLGMASHWGWRPIGDGVPLGMASIGDGIHWGWRHSGLCPFGIVSIRDCVHSGWCPFGIVFFGIVYRIPKLVMHLQALQLAKSGKYQGNSTFTVFKGWCTRIWSRNGISLRIRIAQKLPSEFQKKVMNLQCYVINKHKIYDFSLCKISNMDETPMCFDMLSN